VIFLSPKNRIRFAFHLLLEKLLLQLAFEKLRNEKVSDLFPTKAT